MKEFEYNCRPMVNYLRRTLPKGMGHLNAYTSALHFAEDACMNLTHHGWGKPSGSVKAYFSSDPEYNETNEVKKAYVLCQYKVPCDRRVLGLRAEAVYEEGRQLVKEEKIQQAKEAALTAAIFAAKVGVAVAASQIGMDAGDATNVIDDVIDVIETVRDIYEEVMEICKIDAFFLFPFFFLSISFFFFKSLIYTRFDGQREPAHHERW